MIVLVDYGIGNTGSILNMLKHIGVDGVLSSELSVIEQADKLILPGVGAFDTAMNNLAEKGMIPLLNRLANEIKIPILGICLGMQILGTGSDEGNARGLGWIDFHNVRFDFGHFDQPPKIPHMGWSMVFPKKNSSILENLGEQPRYYFVHTYHPVCKDPANVLLEADYGYTFTAAVQKENIFGVQFHPEKSHKFGMQLLKNFAERC